MSKFLIAEGYISASSWETCNIWNDPIFQQSEEKNCKPSLVFACVFCHYLSFHKFSGRDGNKKELAAIPFHKQTNTECWFIFIFKLRFKFQMSELVFTKLYTGKTITHNVMVVFSVYNNCLTKRSHLGMFSENDPKS